MEFKSLGKKAAGSTKKAKADVPFNVAMRLERINVETEKPSTFEGINIETGEPVTVRMATIDEGALINKRVNETYEEAQARMQKQYVGAGEVHRPRVSEVANPDHKTHCQTGGLLMFTKCMKNDDGTIRAHWVDTLEKAPGAGCDKVMANIRIEDRIDQATKKVVGTQVVVDVVDPQKAVMLNQDNAVQTMLAAFNNRNGDEKLKPFAYLRLISAHDGKIVLPPARANAAYVGIDKVDHETSQKFKVFEAADATSSLTALMSPENVSQDGLIVRAALHGLASEGYGDFSALNDADMAGELQQITDAVRAGDLLVEFVPGQRIAAGPSTRASIEKSVKSNPRNPMNTLYTVRDDNGRTTERRFAETFITSKLGKDGHRLFTKAVPVACYPTGISLMKLSTVNDLKSLTGEAAKERVAEASADVDVPDDDLPFDPTALDKEAMDELDKAMAQSANVLTAEM